MWLHEGKILAVCLWIAGFVIGIFSSKNCDVTISAQAGASLNGSFESPGFKIPGGQYPNNMHCLYKFIGGDNHRVRIHFSHFALQGRYPLCDNDYVDIYAQLLRETDDLLEARLTGRFCGEGMENLPKLIVSTNNVLIISFYTNDNKVNTGFSGTYEFFDDILSVSAVYHMGTEAPPRMCGYTVRSENKLDGYIVSPTYPGMYPDNIFCYYKLVGQPGQRIRLKFEEFVLFHGGDYCPFDYVKIYDGNKRDEDKKIGTFCGLYNDSTVLYSTSETLYIEFITGQGRIHFKEPPLAQEADFSFERKGFNITYKFSDKFVKLGFITEEAKHVVGTECDQRILSTKESNGTIFSPGYPDHFPEGIVCHYYLDGLMDLQHLEKVRITFTHFSVPGNIPYCALGYVGQLEDNGMGRGEVKEKFCGSIRPPVLESAGPRMVLVLNTAGAVQGGVFAARYKFITDYDIPGTPFPDGQCKFYYDSIKTKDGIFNSPRYPTKYPINVSCEYILQPRNKEWVLISFDAFSLAVSAGKTNECDRTDFLAIYEEIEINNFTLMEKFCGSSYVPGPYATPNKVKVIFYSDDKDNEVGFRASIKFMSLNEQQQKCRSSLINGMGLGGTITSPLYPSSYPRLSVCEWSIKASKAANKIMIQMPDLNIEGSGKIDEYNCGKAVLRIYNDRAAYRSMTALCGKNMEDLEFMSAQDSLTIRFVTTATSLGAKGFRISWTEVHGKENCHGFECAKNKYCIAESLKCNQEPNCGQGDNSDETAECPGNGRVCHTASHLVFVLVLHFILTKCLYH